MGNNFPIVPIESLHEGIYQLIVPLPWSKPGFVNVYLIEDKNGYIMIDCGVAGDAEFDVLSQTLCELNLAWSDINILIGTHLHTDHIGLSEKIREEGIPLGLYENSVKYIEKYNDWKLRFQELADYSEKEGAPKEFIEDMRAIETPSLAGTLSTPDVLIKDGESPDKTTKGRLKAIFTPGHDASEVSFIDNKSKILFSGDHILPKITPFVPVENEDSNTLKDFLDSLEKTLPYKKTIIAPGHGDIIQEPNKRIEQMILHHKRRLERVLKLLGEDSLTGWEVCEKLFPERLDIMNRRLALQETLSHLLYLKSKGKVLHNIDNPYFLWSRIKENNNEE